MRARIIAAVTALALATAACGSSSDDDKKPTTASGGGAKTTTIKLGLLPTTANAPIFMGIQRGFFKEEGLDVQSQVLGGSAVVFPSLMSGALQFSFTGASTVIMSRSKGLPIKMVVDAGTSKLAPLMVLKDGPIKSFADLKGKPIGLPSLGSVPEFTTVGALKAAGLDRKEIKLLEVPYAEGQNALERKTVSAVWSSPPFSTRMLKTGKFRSIGTTIGGDLLGLGNSVIAAKEDYLNEHPEVAEKLAKAVDRSTQYATTHVDELLKTISSFMKIEPGLLGPADVAEEVGKLKMDRLQNVATFLRENGYMDKDVAPKDAVWNERWTVAG